MSRSSLRFISAIWNSYSKSETALSPLKNYMGFGFLDIVNKEAGKTIYLYPGIIANYAPDQLLLSFTVNSELLLGL